MCGIAGCVLPPDGAPDRRDLETMAGVIDHRGPDARAIATIGSVGFAHTRLAIVDPTPSGAQPMASPDERWWITYNGEIFNHMELREELGPTEFRGHSDTETLVHCLARWGDDAIPRCNGLYAYAALDVERRRLLLVRDRFGVKPLYIARHRGALWFASEVRALLAIGVPARPRTHLVRHAVTHGWANGPHTLLEGIDQVLPGTTVSVDLETLAATESRWYEPITSVDPARAADYARRSREELTDEFESELRASVRRRLMSDVPIGTMCSGGIDSSLVTAFAREATSRVVAYNASVTEQPLVDESPWATRVADHLGIELRTVDMTAARWRSDLVDVVAHNEFPLMHENSVPMSQIARLARGDGVKVLLSGEGADEQFGGYEHRHRSEYARYLRQRRQFAALLTPAVDRVRRRQLTAWDGLNESVRDLRLKLGRRLRAGGATTVSSVLAAANLSARADEVVAFEEAIVRRAYDAYPHLEGAERSLQAILLADLSTYLPHLLNRQDKNTMMRSIETRVPFLDPAVVGVSVNLPLSARVEPKRKGILRDLAERHLPDGVAHRPKVGFGFDVRRYIDPAARPAFLEDGVLREVLGVARDPWRQLAGAATGAAVLRLWTGEVWCRLFLEGRSAERVREELWAVDPETVPQQGLDRVPALTEMR